MTYDYENGLRLHVEDPTLIPVGKVLNQIKNPDGASSLDAILGGYGWITPSTGTVAYALPPGLLNALGLNTAASGAAFLHSATAPVTAGSAYSATWRSSNNYSTYWHRATMQFLNDAGSVVGS